MKRNELLAHIRFAGYHDDNTTLLRLLIENRISRRVADKAFLDGRNARLAGVKCVCPDCN